MTAIFDLAFTLTSESSHTSFAVLVAGPRSLWNCVAILYTSWDISISRLKTAILDFALPVSSRFVVHYCNYSHWIARSRKHRYSRWNFIAIVYTGWDISISSYVAAILTFWLPLIYLLTHDHHLYNTREISVLKFMGVAIGIVFQTSVDMILPVKRRSQVVFSPTTSSFEPPYWLSGGC